MKTPYSLLFFLGTLLLFGAGCINVELPLKVDGVNPSGGEAFRARTNISGTIRVKLVDHLGEAIANKSVKIKSENGIRCIKAPCNTEAEEWTGTSDSEGLVSLPAKVINVLTWITTEGYPGKDLNNDSQRITDHEWKIVL